MRALERFLIVFAALAVGMRLFHLPTAPVFLILGFSALALYYLVVFPFLNRPPIDGIRPHARLWQRIAWRLISGSGLAYALAGFGAYMLGWVGRGNVLGNSCVITALLLLFNWIVYRKAKTSFALQTLIRAGVLLILALVISVAFLPFGTAR